MMANSLLKAMPSPTTVRLQILRSGMLLQLSFYSENHGNPSLTVANQQLRGSTDLEKAQIIQWFGFADSEILPASCTWVFPCLGIMQYNKVVSSDALLVKSVVLTALTPDYRTRMSDISCVIHVIAGN